MLSTATNPLVEDGGSSSNFPVARNGSSTTLSVAELIAVLALPSIGSFGVDVTAMRTLPPFHFPDDVYTPKLIPAPHSPNVRHPSGRPMTGLVLMMQRRALLLLELLPTFLWPPQITPIPCRSLS